MKGENRGRRGEILEESTWGDFPHLFVDQESGQCIIYTVYIKQETIINIPYIIIMNNMYLKYRYIDHFVVKIVYYLKYEIGSWKF